MAPLRKNSKLNSESLGFPMVPPLCGFDWDFVQRRLYDHMNAYLHSNINLLEKKQPKATIHMVKRAAKKQPDPVTVYELRKKVQEEKKRPLKKNLKQNSVELPSPLKKRTQKSQTKLGCNDMAKNGNGSTNRAKICKMPEPGALAGLLAILDSNGKLKEAQLIQLKEFLRAAVQLSPENVRSYLKMIDGYKGLSPEAAVALRKFLTKTCADLTPTQLGLLVETLHSEFKLYLREFEKSKTQQSETSSTSEMDAPFPDIKNPIYRPTSSKHRQTVVGEHSEEIGAKRGESGIPCFYASIPNTNRVPDCNRRSVLEDADDLESSPRALRFKKPQRWLSQQSETDHHSDCFRSVDFNYGPDLFLRDENAADQTGKMRTSQTLPSERVVPNNYTNQNDRPVLRETLNSDSRTNKSNISSSKSIKSVSHGSKISVNSPRIVQNSYSNGSKLSASSSKSVKRGSHASEVSASSLKTAKSGSQGSTNSVKSVSFACGLDDIPLDNRDLPSEGTRSITSSRYASRPNLGYANRMEPHHKNNHKTPSAAQHYLGKVGASGKMIINIDGQEYCLVKN